VRSLSETGQTSSQGTGGGPSGNAIAAPSGSSGGLSPQSVANDYQQAVQVGTDVFDGANALGLAFREIPLALPLAIIAEDVDFLVNFFEDIFGGGGSPPIPRQLMHARHPLYPVILGVQDGLIPDEMSKGKAELCGDAEFCGTKPLQKAEYASKPNNCQEAALEELRSCETHLAFEALHTEGAIILGCTKAATVAGPEAPVGAVGCSVIAGTPAAIGFAFWYAGCRENFARQVQACGH